MKHRQILLRRTVGMLLNKIDYNCLLLKKNLSPPILLSLFFSEKSQESAAVKTVINKCQPGHMLNMINYDYIVFFF